MKRERYISVTVTLIFIVLCSSWLFWSLFGKKVYDRNSFSQKICQNLVQKELFNETQCYFSKSVPETMGNMFPIGTEIKIVQTGMGGFEAISETTVLSRKCKQLIRLDYVVIHRWGFLFDETYEFEFCDGKLTNTIWHE